MTNRILKVCALAALWWLSVASSAMADGSRFDSRGSDAWMVDGVRSNDVLNARMGPGTNYPIIETFAHDERGLQLITCVPFYTMAHLSEEREAELAALPPRWCLMRSADMGKAGWVAQRFLIADFDDDVLFGSGGPEEGAGVERTVLAPVTSAQAPQQSDDALASLSRQFLSADGYEKQDGSTLAAAIGEQLTPLNPESVFRPVADIGPFVKAVLALEAVDGVIERSRYRIRYGFERIPMPPGGPTPFSFVQVDRFNLGPAFREEAVAALGEENVAPAAAFGEGAHVSWRLVMHPMMGNAAVIDAAARVEISEDDAATMLCLGTPCLSTAVGIMDAAPWSDMEETDRHPEASYRTERDGLPTPAAVIEMLTANVVLELREGVGPTEPYAEAIIELNLGQDTALDAALRDGDMMDDSIRAIWRRISAVAPGPGVLPEVFTADAFECKRGPDFARPGDLCL